MAVRRSRSTPVNRAFGRQIAANRVRTERLRKQLTAPKRATEYTAKAAVKLRAGKSIAPTRTERTKAAVTRQYQFYGPQAYQNMELFLRDVKEHNPDVLYTYVEFSTGYGPKDLRAGTSYKRPRDTIYEAKATANRPSATGIFASDGDYDEIDRGNYSRSTSPPKDTTGVYVDVYTIEPRGKGIIPASKAEKALKNGKGKKQVRRR